MRTRAERRHNDWHKAIRKRKINISTNHPTRLPPPDMLEPDEYLRYRHVHQYSKNSPFDSWGRGRPFKTNNKGKHRYAPGNFSKSKNWSETDKRKLDEMKDQEQELDLEENS